MEDWSWSTVVAACGPLGDLVGRIGQRVFKGREVSGLQANILTLLSTQVE